MTSPPIGLGAHDGIARRREYDAGQRRLGTRAREAGCDGQNLRLSPLRGRESGPVGPIWVMLSRKAPGRPLRPRAQGVPEGATNANLDHQGRLSLRKDLGRRP